MRQISISPFVQPINLGRKYHNYEIREFRSNGKIVSPLMVGEGGLILLPISSFIHVKFFLFALI